MDASYLEALADASDTACVGGKARGLSDMIRCGLPVPPGFVVPVAAFERFAADAFERGTAAVAGADTTDAATRVAVGERARAGLRDVTLPDDFVADLARWLWKLAPEGEPVAVRSSAVGEDGATTSFAGEHDSYLGVRTVDELVDALTRCWASLFSDRAIAYRARSGLPVAPMSVVVQRLVLAESAGVLMSLNPATGDRSVAVVESVWGLAEPLVSGRATPDRFGIDLVTGGVRFREIADKPTFERFDGSGVAEAATPRERMSSPSLGEATLADLRSYLPALQRCAGGGPSDAEFAYDGSLWFVQVRPETYWSQRTATVPPPSVIDAIVSAVTTKR